MPSKTPEFWYRQPQSDAPFIERLLSPISSLYQLGHCININLKTPGDVSVPVICVGNVTVGGSGKTPTIIALQNLLQTESLYKKPFFLTRGYGAKDTSQRVISVHEPFSSAGDEPLLLRKHAETVLSPNRFQGAKLAQEHGADIILMDDGFQNNTLNKDISLLVIDGKYGFGNGKTLPAGPLREPISNAIRRAHAVIIIGEDKTNILNSIPNNTVVFHAHIEADISELDRTNSYIGFAGLGLPEKFKDTLEQNEFKLAAFHAFADHHPYTDDDIQTLIDEAQSMNAALITTEKDYVRIPQKFKTQIKTLPIRLIWHNPQDIVSFLKTHLDQKEQ